MLRERAYAPACELKLRPSPIIRRRFSQLSSIGSGVDARRRCSAFCGALVVAVAIAGVSGTAQGEELAARRARLHGELSQALDAQDEWLGSGANGQAWRRYLGADALRDQLTADTSLDVIALDRVLARYERDVAGLDRPQFRHVNTALARWINVLPAPTIADLTRLARSASEHGASSVANNVDESERALVTAFDTLEQYLAASREHGAAWRTFLASDELAEELDDTKGANLDRLETILSQYESGYLGLDLPEFRDVQTSLASYCRRLRSSRLDGLAAAERACLARLAAHLEEHECEGGEKHLHAIGERLAWLERHGLGSDVVRAVRRRYAQSNLYAQVAGETFLSEFAQSIDEQFDIRDTINDAFITGTGTLQGNVKLRFVPNEDRAAIEMLFDGDMRSNTVGSSGPVVFAGSGRTQLSARKMLFADADGIRAIPTETDAQTSLDVADVWSTFSGPLKDRIARRIGWKRILEGRSSSERAVSTRAQRDLRARFDSEAGELATALNETYAEMIRVPLAAQGIFPRNLRLSTTHDHFRIEATVAAPQQLAATSPPPSFDGPSAMSVAIHESLINNATATTLSGRTVESYEFATVVEQLYGSVPITFDNVDGVPWSLTLAESAPLEVQFDGGRLQISIRCRKITAGPEEFSIPFSVTAQYRGSIDGDAIVLAREGDVELDAPLLAAQIKVNPELTDSRDKLVERFEMLFAEQLRFTSSQAPFDPPAGTEIVPCEFRTEDGWLLAAFDLQTVGPDADFAGGD